VIKFQGWVQRQTWISMIFQYCSHLAFTDYYLLLDEGDIREYMRVRYSFAFFSLSIEMYCYYSLLLFV
jgi:hypothetical protein